MLPKGCHECWKILFFYKPIINFFAFDPCYKKHRNPSFHVVLCIHNTITQNKIQVIVHLQEGFLLFITFLFNFFQTGPYCIPSNVCQTTFGIYKHVNRFSFCQKDFISTNVVIKKTQLQTKQDNSRGKRYPFGLFQNNEHANVFLTIMAR